MKKTQEYKDGCQLPCIFCAGKDENGQLLEKSDLLEAIHHTHETEQEREYTEINIR